MLAKISQKDLPVAMSIIDLLLLHPAAEGEPEMQSGLTALHAMIGGIWETIDEAIHTIAGVVNEAHSQEAQASPENFS